MKIVIALVVLGTAGLLGGCCFDPCAPAAPCCPEPVYSSPCCPAPTGGISGTGAAPMVAPGGGPGRTDMGGGWGTSCGGGGRSCG
jgi:hypothetical protein